MIESSEEGGERSEREGTKVVMRRMVKVVRGNVVKIIKVWRNKKAYGMIEKVLIEQTVLYPAFTQIVQIALRVVMKPI